VPHNLDVKPVRHAHLGELGLHPPYVRHDRREIRHSQHCRGRENARTARTGRRCLPQPVGRGGIRRDAASYGQPKWGLGEFGGTPDLGHTVQVALRRLDPSGRAGPGIRPAPKRARPVPPFDRDGFSTRLRLRAGDTPERGDRCTRTGEQRRRHGASSKDAAPETTGRAGVRKKRGGTEDPHQAQGL
jgi:hypothetical protein